MKVNADQRRSRCRGSKETLLRPLICNRRWVSSHARVMMAQADKSTASATSTSIIADLSEIGKKRAEAVATMQAELFKEFQEISQYWTGRAKTEADLASELLSKLTDARSVQETAKAYRNGRAGECRWFLR